MKIAYISKNKDPFDFEEISFNSKDHENTEADLKKEKPEELKEPEKKCAIL